MRITLQTEHIERKCRIHTDVIKYLVGFASDVWFQFITITNAIPRQKTLRSLRLVGKALACQIKLTLLDTSENIVHCHR